MRWQPVIGLEIHARLQTKSKLFSGASSKFNEPPNTQACAIDVALPGTLPVLNCEAVRMAVAFGLAINGEIDRCPIFARKNYFYPDLPKGYQISQYEHPIVAKGRLKIRLKDRTQKMIGITRAHLEEDAGKSVHEGLDGRTGIDLNRAGTPLIEIVSEPELHSAEEAGIYMREIHGIVTCLGICDGNMQEGSFRCDANVSLRPQNSEALGTRAEIKNLNSFRFVEKAIAYEIKRQTGILEAGGQVIQETRLFDVAAGKTRSMRGKEEAHDYRYFPDPDLLPVAIDRTLIDEVRAALPELPAAKAARFSERYGLAAEDAERLALSAPTAHYFETCAAATRADPAVVLNWIRGTLSAALNRHNLGIDEAPITAKMLADLLDRVYDATLSTKIAREVFDRMWTEGSSAGEIIEKEGIDRIDDENVLAQTCDRVVADHAKQAKQYRAGKTKVLAYLVGQVMKATSGKADPAQVSDILKRRLSSG